MQEPYHHQHNHHQIPHVVQGDSTRLMPCPVRVVYDTQLLVAPGDRIQPNQIIYFNSHNQWPHSIGVTPNNNSFYLNQIHSNMTYTINAHNLVMANDNLPQLPDVRKNCLTEHPLTHYSNKFLRVPDGNKNQESQTLERTTYLANEENAHSNNVSKNNMLQQNMAHQELTHRINSSDNITRYNVLQQNMLQQDSTNRIETSDNSISKNSLLQQDFTNRIKTSNNLSRNNMLKQYIPYQDFTNRINTLQNMSQQNMSQLKFSHPTNPPIASQNLEKSNLLNSTQLIQVTPFQNDDVKMIPQYLRLRKCPPWILKQINDQSSTFAPKVSQAISDQTPLIANNTKTNDLKRPRKPDIKKENHGNEQKYVKYDNGAKIAKVLPSNDALVFGDRTTRTVDNENKEKLLQNNLCLKPACVSTGNDNKPEKANEIIKNCKNLTTTTPSYTKQLLKGKNNTIVQNNSKNHKVTSINNKVDSKTNRYEVAANIAVNIPQEIIEPTIHQGTNDRGDTTNKIIQNVEKPTHIVEGNKRIDNTSQTEKLEEKNIEKTELKNETTVKGKNENKINEKCMNMKVIRNGKEMEMKNKNFNDTYILTHVLEQYVIQESNCPFPIMKPHRKTSVSKEDILEKLEPSINENLEMNGNEELKFIIFRGLTPELVKTWNTNRLVAHLVNMGYEKSANILREQELDGESLSLVTPPQLLTVGIEEDLAVALCGFMSFIEQC